MTDTQAIVSTNEHPCGSINVSGHEVQLCRMETALCEVRPSIGLDGALFRSYKSNGMIGYDYDGGVYWQEGNYQWQYVGTTKA